MMNRNARISWCLVLMGILFLSLMSGTSCKKRIQPPNAPATPWGPTSARRGDSCQFATVAEAPDTTNSVAVRFDWGDGTMSDWGAAVPSGETVAMTHAWQSLGTFSIRAQARDAQETASVWSDAYQLAVSSFSVAFGGSGRDWGGSVQPTSDSGYIITGYTASYGAGGNDVWLVKTDSSGSQLWAKTFGGPANDEGYSVQQTSDGGYIVTGATASYGAGGNDVWLIKTDASGNKVWDKTFGGAGDDQGNSVQQTSDGGYIIVGWYGAGGRDVWLIKTDASGNKTWDQTFGGTGDDEGYSVQPTTDGGYIVAGLTNSYGAGGYDVWLIKTDASGNKTWDKTLGGTGDDEGFSVQQTSDGGYVVTGYTESYGAGGRDVWLIRTDASGNHVWDKTFGGALDDQGNSVRQTADGGYIIAGWTESYGAGNYSAWLIKTDTSGNEVWDQTYGPAGYEGANCVRPTFDGGYIVTGWVSSLTPGDFDLSLIKTDADGN